MIPAPVEMVQMVDGQVAASMIYSDVSIEIRIASYFESVTVGSGQAPLRKKDLRTWLEQKCFWRKAL